MSNNTQSSIWLCNYDILSRISISTKFENVLILKGFNPQNRVTSSILVCSINSLALSLSEQRIVVDRLVFQLRLCPLKIDIPII